VGTRLTAVIVDQWQLVAVGIETVLRDRGIDVVASVADARLGVRATREHRAGLFVLGATAVPAVEAVRHVAQLRPRPAVLALVTATDRSELGQLIADGVDGLLVRGATTNELGDAVDRICKNERYVAPALLSTLIGGLVAAEETTPTEGSPALTAREREVLACLAQAGPTARSPTSCSSAWRR